MIPDGGVGSQTVPGLGTPSPPAPCRFGGPGTFTMAELSTLPAAAVVVEDRYTALFKGGAGRAWLAARTGGEDAGRVPQRSHRLLRHPEFAEEWTYRFLGAALAELGPGASD